MHSIYRNNTVLFILVMLTSMISIVNGKQVNNRLSESAQVSLLTCSKGKEILTAFGHSAIRFNDPESGVDIVFNYGAADFDSPDLYKDMLICRMDYYLVIERISDFVKPYKQSGRGVVEQVLDMTDEEKELLLDRLLVNAEEANRQYRYHYVYNNCSSKAFDELSAIRSFVGDGTLGAGTSFREQMYEHLYFSPWFLWHLDMVMGPVAEQELSVDDMMFLPERCMARINTSTDLPVIVQNTILKAEADKGCWHFGPVMFFALVYGLTLVVMLLKWTTVLRGISLGLILYTGLMGCAIIFFWFFSDHEMGKGNFNLLWALPINVPMPLLLLLPTLRPMLNRYMKIYFGWCLLCLIVFPLLPQSFAMSTYMLLGLMATMGVHQALISRQKKTDTTVK